MHLASEHWSFFGLPRALALVESRGRVVGAALCGPGALRPSSSWASAATARIGHAVGLVLCGLAALRPPSSWASVVGASWASVSALYGLSVCLFWAPLHRRRLHLASSPPRRGVGCPCRRRRLRRGRPLGRRRCRGCFVESPCECHAYPVVVVCCRVPRLCWDPVCSRCLSSCHAVDGGAGVFLRDDHPVVVAMLGSSGDERLDVRIVISWVLEEVAVVRCGPVRDRLRVVRSLLSLGLLVVSHGGHGGGNVLCSPSAAAQVLQHGGFLRDVLFTSGPVGGLLQSGAGASPVGVVRGLLEFLS